MNLSEVISKVRITKILAVPLVCLCSTAMLLGCAGTVTVSEDYPVPLVDPLPFNVGYLLDFDFRSYTYNDDDSSVSFDLGPQQSALFANVFTAVFQQATAVDELSGEGLDLILQPKLTEYAYLSPEDTASKFYAASMKYQVRIYSADGDLLGYWPLVAYGKSRTKLLNRREALGEATSLALRDAAAALATKFRDAVEKEQWRKDEETQAAN